MLRTQKNVGLLEKIIQSLSRSPNNPELTAQYRVQTEVLEMLQAKIEKLLQPTTTTTSAAAASTQQSSSSSVDQQTKLIKLKRDFERVRQRVQSLCDGVERLKQQQHTYDSHLPAAAAASNISAANAAAAAATQQQQSEFERMQLQMQEDVSYLCILLLFCVGACKVHNSHHAPYSRSHTLTHSLSLTQCTQTIHTQRLHEEIMREREEEIRNINRGMHQVNEIYKDLATFVDSQQEQIDTIETQMEDSKANAESGLKQIERANEKFGSGQCVIS